MANIKISELNQLPANILIGEDYAPMVDSSSAQTYKFTFAQLQTFISTGSFSGSFSGSYFGTSSFASASISSSFSRTSSYSTFSNSGSYAYTASYALSSATPGVGGNGTSGFVPIFNGTSNIVNSDISRVGTIYTFNSATIIANSFTGSIGVNIKPNYFPYYNSNNQLSSVGYYFRFNTGSITSAGPVSLAGDVQFSFNDYDTNNYGNFNNNVLRIDFKGTASVTSPVDQSDEIVKIVAGTKNFAYNYKTIPRKILGVTEGTYEAKTIRFYSGTRLQSSSFSSFSDAAGMLTPTGSWNSSYYPLYTVPVMSLDSTYDSDTVRFKEGVAKSLRRVHDANIPIDPFFQPFSSVRISLDSVTGPTAVTGSVSVANNSFYFPHYYPESAGAITSPMMNFTTATTGEFDQSYDYDYYESVVPLYKGQRVTLEYDQLPNGQADSASAPPGYFQSSGSFNCIVKCVASGGFNNSNIYAQTGSIFELVSPTTMPDWLYYSGLVHMPNNQMVLAYHNQTGSIPYDTLFFTMTSGSNQVKNRFLLTQKSNITYPPYVVNMNINYQFSASFYPVFSVEHMDATGNQFYLSPLSCSADALVTIGSGSLSGSGGLYITDSNLSGSKIFKNFQNFYSPSNYVNKVTTGTQFSSGRPLISGIKAGKTMKIKKANTYPVKNSSKLKQQIFLRSSGSYGQITSSFVIAGIPDGFVDGQELSIYNESNYTASFYGIGHPYVTSSVYFDSKIMLPRAVTSSVLEPQRCINMIYCKNSYTTSDSYWRVISQT